MEIKTSGDFLRVTRGALAAAGFVRQESAGTVWWTSALAPREVDGESAPHPNPLPTAMKLPRGEGTRLSEGSPPVLVMVHGANDHAGTWFTVAAALAERYRVILPDLAGHGESEPRSGPIPVSQILARLEVAIGHERDITLLGNSLGGWMALLYTLRR